MSVEGDGMCVSALASHIAPPGFRGFFSQLITLHSQLPPSLPAVGEVHAEQAWFAADERRDAEVCAEITRVDQKAVVEEIVGVERRRPALARASPGEAQVDEGVTAL